MSDAPTPPTLTAWALHNTVASLTMAYGGALADKDREIAVLKDHILRVTATLDMTEKNLVKAQEENSYLRGQLKVE